MRLTVVSAGRAQPRKRSSGWRRLLRQTAPLGDHTASTVSSTPVCARGELILDVEGGAIHGLGAAVPAVGGALHVDAGLVMVDERYQATLRRRRRRRPRAVSSAHAASDRAALTGRGHATGAVLA